MTAGETKFPEGNQTRQQDLLSSLCPLRICVVSIFFSTCIYLKSNEDGIWHVQPVNFSPVGLLQMLQNTNNPPFPLRFFVSCSSFSTHVTVYTLPTLTLLGGCVATACHRQVDVVRREKKRQLQYLPTCPPIFRQGPLPGNISL